ncbi:hypothetical protein [Streptomyces niveus]
MTGPEHYGEAERRLLMAWEEGRDPESVRHLLAEAQVHATLALAAATALSEPSRSAPRATVPEWHAWHAAAGVQVPPKVSAYEDGAS